MYLGVVLLNHRRILLGYEFDLVHRTAYFIDALGLLSGGCGYLIHQILDAADTGYDFSKGYSILLDQSHSISYLSGTAADKYFDLVCSAGTSLGQFTNLLSHHCKSPSRVACACRLHTRIESEKVCLERNFIDNANYGSDFF